MTPKLFRKFYGTYQAEQKMDPALLQKMMGHAPGSCVTDKHYKHFSENALRNSIIRLPRICDQNEALPKRWQQAIIH